MSEHPINGLMQTAMENIKEMVDVNTIVGEPVETPDGSVIIPISRVGFGFAAGGSEFSAEEAQKNGGASTPHNASVQLPFGGGSGGGVSITPIAFLVVGTQGVKVVPLDNQTHIFERLIESAPQWVDKVRMMFQGGGAQMGMSGGALSGMSSAGMTGGTMTGGTMSGSSMAQSSIPAGGMASQAHGGTAAGGMASPAKGGTAAGASTNTVPVAPKPTDHKDLN